MVTDLAATADTASAIAHPMPPMLRWTLSVIDVGMIAYWSISAIALAGLIALPQSAMYDGYGTPIIDAWNWSFAPLDLIFSVCGLIAIRLASRNDPRWRGAAVVSLALTFCAGLMAVAFWAIRGEYNLSWWVPNLLLMALPLIWLPSLIRNMR